MKAKDIKQLKELSAEVVRMYSGLFPWRGTRDKLAELNQLIQRIEGRKVAVKKAPLSFSECSFVDIPLRGVVVDTQESSHEPARELE